MREVFRGFVAAVAAFAYLWTCRRVGARARALGRPLLRNGGGIEIGEDVLIDSTPAPVELAVKGAGRLIVGHGVRIGPGARLEAAHYIEIGDGVRIGAGCIVCDDRPVRSAPDEGAAIWIGDSVVLGDGVNVAPGTVIGAGSVIAAGCSVSGIVPPLSFVDGTRAAFAESDDDLRIGTPARGGRLAVPSPSTASSLSSA